jgi:hypothetical protein
MQRHVDFRARPDLDGVRYWAPSGVKASFRLGS